MCNTHTKPAAAALAEVAIDTEILKKAALQAFPTGNLAAG